jgi:NitT/TauT family transport system ATP-binding protein
MPGAARVIPLRLRRDFFQYNRALMNSRQTRADAPAIAVEDLVKRFPGQARDVLHRITFAVPTRQCISLLGPSGCGKTTLLRLLMGIERPTSGALTIHPALVGHVSYVFQEPRLVPWRTSVENVRLPLELAGAAAAASHAEIAALLTQLGLGERLDNFPRELSGGMQMRVALARALITQPKILLLDEPFAALDERTRFRLQDLLLELRAGLELQYVFVTHSISEAAYLGDRVLLMDQNGRIDTDQTIDFGSRDQTLKLTPQFNQRVSAIAERFTALERAA